MKLATKQFCGILTVLIFLCFLMMTTADAQPKIEPGISLELAKWRAAHYSNVRYKLDITLEKQAPLMKGKLEIRVELTEEGARHPLVLDWRTTPFLNDKDQPFANVTAVNDAMDFRTQLNQEHILIANGALKTGENIVKIEFASPIKPSGAAVTRYIDKQDGAEYLYTLFVPSDASMAFPAFDQPDLKARFSLTVLAPQNWNVVANTANESFSPASENDSTKSSASQLGQIHQFAETRPISTYVFAFAAGDFTQVSEPSAVADGLTRKTENIKRNKRSSNNPTVSNAKLQPSATADGSDLSTKIYVRKSQAEKFKTHAKEVFRLNRESVKFFEDYFDYKFPFPKYDLVLIPEFPFGGMEHSGATFLRESSIIFPSEPTKNDLVTRANLIFHEAAHQWFGDTVTMKWFDDLWLKEGFATFIGYKALEKIMPEYNAWKIFYERQKQSAYLTDATRGTTPIYQEIPNLSAAKSAYGNIVYSKAPAFLKQAEFYLGADKFQMAVRSFLKKYEFKNASWTDLVAEFKNFAGQDFTEKSGIEPEKWAQSWVTQRGLPIVRVKEDDLRMYRPREEIEKTGGGLHDTAQIYWFEQEDAVAENKIWNINLNVLLKFADGQTEIKNVFIRQAKNYEFARFWIITNGRLNDTARTPAMVFPNYQDYGYGIFLLDEKSRNYVLQNIQTEKNDFLRTMMWGALWDSVREAELDPRIFVELVIKNIAVENDESTIQTLLNRAGVALNYYIADDADPKSDIQNLKSKIENVLLERLANAPTIGQRITFYRAFLSLASSANARRVLKDILAGRSKVAVFALRTKDKFDVVTRLLILGDTDAPALLANLEKTETGDDAKRYAYAARAGIGTAPNKAKYWNDFVGNKDLSESWIEAAFAVFNNSRHAELTQPFLEKSLAELPNLKRTRKIFFVNGWLGAFIGGQKNERALEIIKRFLEDNPNLDKDLRLKILENSDTLERAARIRQKFESKK